jgi:Zn-dependent alcohol dehydrogenase
MNTKAAVLWERGQPLSVEEVELDPPGPGEVLVEIQAAGVCHSDLHPAFDEWPMRPPLVLGHEGAGIVREVGPHVTRLSPGDRVVLCWAPACGTCPACSAGRAVLCDRLDETTYKNKLASGTIKLRARGQQVRHFLSTACFAGHAVIAEEGAVRVDGDVPFPLLAMIGCAVVTGVGAVMTAGRVPRGARVAVVGAGGVGLNAVQGAVIAGCERIIALDRQPASLALASRLGATDAVNTTASEPVDAVRQLTGGIGADYVFDTVGTAETIGLALAATRKGGTVVVTGLSRIDAQAPVGLFPFVMQEKHLIGSVYGSGRPADDIVRLVDWHRAGRLKLKELVGRSYPLEGVNEALRALRAGQAGRAIIEPQAAEQRA